MDGREKYRYLDPKRVRELKEEGDFTLENLATVLCRVEHRRMSRSGETAETVAEYEDRRKYSALKFVSRKCSDSSLGKGTEWEAAEDLALVMAVGPSVPPGEAAWKEAERRAQGYLERMLIDCVVPPDPVPPDPAADLLRSMVTEARAIADRVRDYVDSEGVRLNELLRAGTPPIADNPPSLSRLWEVLKRSEVGRTDVKQIDEAVRAARKKLDDVMAAREHYGAERHASASLFSTQGFTADTMRQYAADCRIDAEYADALGRSDEAARVRDFAKRYEAHGRLLGAMEPLKETIESSQHSERLIPEQVVVALVDASINRDVRHTDALHKRLEATFMALSGKTALALKQADRVRQKPKTDRDEGTTKSDD